MCPRSPGSAFAIGDFPSWNVISVGLAPGVPLIWEGVFCSCSDDGESKGEQEQEGEGNN